MTPCPAACGIDLYRIDLIGMLLKLLTAPGQNPHLTVADWFLSI